MPRRYVTTQERHIMSGQEAVANTVKVESSRILREYIVLDGAFDIRTVFDTLGL